MPVAWAPRAAAWKTTLPSPLPRFEESCPGLHVVLEGLGHILKQERIEAPFVEIDHVDHAVDRGLASSAGSGSASEP